MLKAKQNSFLKWFIGIVLLIVALCSFMTTAFAAGAGYNCSNCPNGFRIRTKVSTIKAFGINYIPGIGNYVWTTSTDGEYASLVTTEGGDSGGGEADLCPACVAKKVAAYKASLTLNATVPASLPIHVGEDGKVTTASNASITNNGSKPIVISSINIAASSGWTVQSKVDATNAKAGSKVIAIGFNNSWATPNSGNASGSVNTSDFGKISASGTLNLAYDAVIPVAAAGGSSDETAATATIVVAFPEAPTLAAGPNWYKSSVNRNTITKITLMDSYTPKTTADETWAADVNGTGDITCYRTGTEIIIAGNGTGKIRANTDSSCMFQRCNGLTSLDLSNFNTSNVTDMSYMFSYCYKLTNLDVSGFNTSNVTNMHAMFFYCSGLTSLDLSNFNTSNVTDMSYMFSYCNGLTNLDVSGFNTSNVTNMHAMFPNCGRLTSLDLSNFNTSNVTDMSSMFYNCSRLTNLDVSGFNTSNVTDMSSMFSDCSGLTTIYAGDTWNTDKVTKSGNMFSGCTNLKGDIAYNSSYTDKKYAKTSGGYLSIKPATLAVGSSWYKSSKNQSAIKKITFMDAYTPSTAADESWVADVNGTGDITCYRTGTEIIIAGNGAGKIKANANSSNLFSNATFGNRFTSLTTIENLGILDTSNVTNMDYMFRECEELTSLNLSNFNTSNVTSMSYMFDSCYGLTSLDVSNFDTSNITDMSGMFYSCHGLTSLNLSNFNTSNVTKMFDMFTYCYGLTSLNVSNFSTSNVTSMGAMFESCSGLTSLDVSNFNTSNVTYMGGMFYDCRGLTTIYAGDNWNTDKVTSSSRMFSGCTKLPNFSSSKVDKTAATFTTNGGYLTHKAATKSLKLNVDKSGTVNGYTEQSTA